MFARRWPAFPTASSSIRRWSSSSPIITFETLRHCRPRTEPFGGRWRLEGSTTNDFTEQIEGLFGQLAQDWRVRTSPVTGNPLYVNPAVLVLYRADRRFLLEPLIPDREATASHEFDLMIASQAYRARTPIESKVRKRPGPAGSGPGTGRPPGRGACPG